jgi:hypothetical protein
VLSTGADQDSVAVPDVVPAPDELELPEEVPLDELLEVTPLDELLEEPPLELLELDAPDLRCPTLPEWSTSAAGVAEATVEVSVPVAVDEAPSVEPELHAETSTAIKDAATIFPNNPPCILDSIPVHPVMAFQVVPQKASGDQAMWRREDDGDAAANLVASMPATPPSRRSDWIGDRRLCVPASRRVCP